MFISLDFLYMPSSDPGTEAGYFSDTLGAKLVFAIEAFGARVAMVELTEGAPALLFADHLDGERPILVYRVADLDTTVTELEAQGCEVGAQFGIPPGPCAEIIAPGGHRLAIYELTRPEAPERLAGRLDF